MREISLKEGLTVQEFCDTLKEQTKGVGANIAAMNWKLVGIRAYFINEETDICASPGVYANGFNYEDYEGD